MQNQLYNSGYVYVTLSSKGEENDSLSYCFDPPLSLPRGKETYVSLEGISCPGKNGEVSQNDSDNILKVCCPETDSDEGVLCVEAKSNEFFHHRWGNAQTSLPLLTSELRRLTLSLHPPGRNESQPSIAVMKIHTPLMPSSFARFENFFSSREKTVYPNHANDFQVRIPENVRRHKHAAFEVALSAITFNPQFRPLPFVIDNRGKYTAIWRKTGEKKDNISTKLFKEVLPDTTTNYNSIFSLAYSLIKSMLADNRLCHIDTEINSEQKDKINVTWLFDGVVKMPNSIAYLLGWEEAEENADPSMFKSKAVTESLESTFSLRGASAKAWIPRNLHIKADFIEGDERMPILKTIPITHYADGPNDYVTYEAANLEYHAFKFPNRENLTFQIMTPDGKFAAFLNDKSIVNITCSFRHCLPGFEINNDWD